jgi:16S rRNA (cytosine967-C5)-methyltransferase
VSHGSLAREAALRILQKVREGEPFDSAHATAVADLTDPDKRLAHEIAAGVLRNRTALDRVLQPLVRSDWNNVEPDLQDLLRIGSYQITRLDRVPDYAAVQATVEVAKRARGPKGAGLVNAVLRKVASRALEPEPDSGPEAERIAERYSHPKWLVERWVEQFGLEPTVALLEHNNRRPRLVIQPARWSLNRLRRSLTGTYTEVCDAPFGAGLVVSGGRVEELAGYSEGGFVVQDPAQAQVLRYADPPTGKLVWDVCASPGGKAAILSLRGAVVATELRRDRIARLRQTLSRVAPDMPIVVADGRTPPLGDRSIDFAIVDAPCTATGSLARHPDARWKLSPQSIVRAAELQGQLLDGASRTIDRKGRLIYATCSLEPEENAVQVEQFLERHPDFVRDGEDMFVFPPDDGTDGAFAARLRRAR